jgi:hypothetical protein
MGLPREINLTPEGGRFYQAQAFRYAITLPALPVVACALLLAIVNPFWFRAPMFTFVERKVNDFSRWRNYRMYAIYLGCDPRVWHTLKNESFDHDAGAQASP